MKIGGLQKVSMLDFPGKIAAVVFTLGCPFRCPFCHNPELVIPEKFVAAMDETELWAFLASRKGMLEGVVITGGEPTLQPDLIEFMTRIHELGYAIKLDSNGAFPDRLERALASGVVDYIAMDIKAGADSYSAVAGVPIDMAKIRRSMELIRASGISYEWRTTIVPELPTDTTEIAKLLKKGETIYLQKFRPSEGTIDPSLTRQTAPEEQAGILQPLLDAGMRASWR